MQDTIVCHSIHAAVKECQQCGAKHDRPQVVHQDSIFCILQLLAQGKPDIACISWWSLSSVWFCSSLVLCVPQETEGELFQRKSQWSEGFQSVMEIYWRLVSFFTLWKTSIQSVEGKHGNISHTHASWHAGMYDMSLGCLLCNVGLWLSQSVAT